MGISRLVGLCADFDLEMENYLACHFLSQGYYICLASFRL